MHFSICGCTVNEISDVALSECIASRPADHVTPACGVCYVFWRIGNPANPRREYGTHRLNVDMAVCQNSLILHPGRKEKPRCKRAKMIFHRGEIRAATHRHAGLNPPTRCFSASSTCENEFYERITVWCVAGSGSVPHMYDLRRPEAEYERISLLETHWQSQWHTD